MIRNIIIHKHTLRKALFLYGSGRGSERGKFNHEPQLATRYKNTQFLREKYYTVPNRKKSMLRVSHKYRKFCGSPPQEQALSLKGIFLGNFHTSSQQGGIWSVSK